MSYFKQVKEQNNIHYIYTPWAVCIHILPSFPLSSGTKAARNFIVKPAAHSISGRTHYPMDDNK